MLRSKSFYQEIQHKIKSNTQVTYLKAKVTEVKEKGASTAVHTTLGVFESEKSIQ